MTFKSRSSLLGTLIAVASLAAGGFSTAAAETVATVNGADIDSTVFDAYLESRFQKPAAQATPDELATVEQELTDIYLLTTQPKAEEFSEDPQIKAQLELQYRGTIAQAVARDFVTTNPASDAEILAEYEAQLEQSSDQQYKARHILVQTQAEAQDLIAQLDEGADFQALAKEHSTGPSGPNGGDLGWFAPDQMVKPFADAVIALDDGAFTTAPVQTQFGWHVILREESRENEPPTLESVRDAIKQRVEQTKFQDYMQGLRDASSEG
ncbi:MAG: peptidylprolyl isomerase [Gammaproteobacteria bacterium]|jgi:peptidyl-prolyl cis-trans isomerase C|nr:peptidylprolyl isomerase [Gammaproteobacteria bacterium]MDH3953687.1 peptidylprolyl isomerase [Gammaproteobacteria bacterium]NCF59661.1 peptidylprolyl isomerase [Gammaproteobacteria bacterium]